MILYDSPTDFLYKPTSRFEIIYELVQPLGGSGAIQYVIFQYNIPIQHYTTMP